MTWNSTVGLISVVALVLPIILILTLRLAWYKSFPALLAYYILLVGYNVLALDLIRVNKTFVHYFGVLNNLLDAPLMLAFMTYFSKTALFRNRMKLIIPILVLFEVIVIAIYGFNVDAAVIVLAPGLLLALCFSLLFFIHQAKITVIYQKAAGKAFIAAALLFAYGGYCFIYVVYYILKTPYKTDSLTIYYLINIFSPLLLTAGIYLESRRVKQLTELKIAREELRVVYGRS